MKPGIYRLADLSMTETPEVRARVRSPYGQTYEGTLTVARTAAPSARRHWVLRMANPAGPDHPAGPFVLLNLDSIQQVAVLP